MKKLTEEIERLHEQNELKTGWISLLTHDFKEAFGSLLWTIEAVENETISKDDFFKLLVQIKKDTKKNLQTITDTNQWLRTQMDNFELKKSELLALDMFIKLRKEFEGKLNKKQIDFQFKGDESVIFESDKFLIHYILSKFTDNAIKYSHKKSTIYFEVEKTDKSVVLSLIDAGTGMTASTQKTLFTFQNPVFQGTEKEKGAGLSLHVAKNFVLLVQGKIEVESTENVGTKISMILPLI
ncbi:HAMP domain-containing histidine kinase [Aequorivita sp. F47161]|uniref:histidine kinase n=1 Tax=Aequorivita vitellina TaxID=2874475 RepID=A0A9X1QV35_9FLAO|nr:HAMP domain-containing sensor histidine kinase [Aequorivita vitellina]MCG2417942.1 HAMP domain-containing histidine kinase [Aequorivita vitellina]